MQLELLLYSMSKYYTLEDCVVLYVDDFGSYGLLDYPVSMLPQLDFKLDTEETISQYDRVCFLCDDDVFYQNTLVPDLGPFETFSLRLGSNVQNQKHFKYTISLDGNILRSEDILPLMEPLQYNNPNELERSLVKYHDKFTMKWHRQCLIGIPHNRVSSTSHCIFTGKYSVQELDDLYREGYRIRNLDFDQQITDVHADIDFNMVSKLDAPERRYNDNVSR